MNRFASAKRRVQCVRRNQELPGLKRRPYPGELGERIFREISAAAWDEWVEHSKMIINEYRINSADPESMRLLMEQCEQFLYGGAGVERPEGYVPQ
ncbi:MAG: oxidative damage protection protein [Myxococcota bacterium]